MRRIYKYAINDSGPTLLPVSAEIVSAGLDPTGVPVVWAYVGRDAEPYARAIFVKFTGDQVADNAVHLATFTAGRLVYHVVEVPR